MSQQITPASCQSEKRGPAQEGGEATMDVEKGNPPPEAPRDGEADGDGSDSGEETQLERWNESPTNIFRFGVALFGFVLMGMTDAVLGVSEAPQGAGSSKQAC